MTIEETVAEAAAIMFEGETVAVVRGQRITETPVGFAVNGFILGTVGQAAASARLTAIGERTSSEFRLLEAQGADDFADSAIGFDGMPAA